MTLQVQKLMEYLQQIDYMDADEVTDLLLLEEISDEAETVEHIQLSDAVVQGYLEWRMTQNP